MIINGQTYSAINDGKNAQGQTIWLVRWFKPHPNEDSANDFVEAEIVNDSDDPEVAIRAAIERGSWA